MKRKTAISSFISLIVLFGCNSDREFSERKNLSEFNKTIFVPTLEHKITNDSNYIYCATLLFAWDEIRKQIESPLTISEKDYDLNLVHNSSTFEDVLKSEEYDASGEIDGDKIKARAVFKKSLPYKNKLINFNGELTFDGQRVSSFGVRGFDSYKLLRIIEIMYYKNDDDFIIKLLPENTEHEILLFKTTKEFHSLVEMKNEIEKLTLLGQSESKNEKTNWKYQLSEDDKVVIPKFDFNIETNYTGLEGCRFNTKDQNFLVTKAWQSTAFIFDENGAKIKSESVFEAATEEMDEDRPKPKKMIFDKPFLILLKRVDADNPYFGLWTSNAELMIKE